MTARLKIVMVAACPFPWPRGTPTRILRMAEALARRGHEVHVATYHLGEAYDDSAIRVHRIRRIGSYHRTSPGPTYRKLLWLDPLLAGLVRRVVREVGCDVIHAHHYEGLLVASPARGRPRRPVIYDAHTILESELPAYGLGLPAGIKLRLGRALDRRLPRWADHVIAVTERIRHRLVHEAGLAPDGVSVVPNGVETELFTADADRARGAADANTVIFTGNLSSYQGIDLLLEAFAKVHAERNDARLRIVSNDSFAPHEELAARLGIRDRIDVVRATFRDLPDHLAEADVAVSPRLDADGLPQKVLNYMAAGKPTVSFSGSATSLEHGHTGWIVDGGDAEALARGILRVLADPALAREMGARARSFVASHRTWEQTASRTEQVYERVLHGDRS